MRNFRRAIRESLRYRCSLALALCCSLLVALCWAANIGTVYPFVELVCRGDSLHGWLNGRVAELEKKRDEIRGRIADLEALPAPGPETAAELAGLEERLAAEEKALAAASHLRPWVERLLPTDPFDSLLLILVFLLAGTLLRDAFVLANSALVARAAHRTTLELRQQLYARTLEQDLAALGKGRTGELMSRLMGDVSRITDGLIMVFGKVVQEPLKMAACLVGAAYISWRLLLVSLVVAPFAVLLIFYFVRMLKSVNRRLMEEMARVYTQVCESLQGIQVVQAFGMEKFEQRKFEEKSEQLYRRSMSASLCSGLARLNTDFLSIGIICLAMLAGGYLVLKQETHLLGFRMTDRPIGFGALMVFYAFIIGVTDPIRKLSEVLNSLQGAAAAADRVYPMLDQQPTITSPAVPRPVPEPVPGLVFDHVDFHYSAGEPVLHDFCLEIRAGEVLALVGPNGCGKSTLVNLVPRFYDPVGGSIRVGGIDLRELALDGWRRRIGILTQQPQLFDDTVANNIRYGSLEATDAEVVRAAELAHAHSFITRVLEQGYATNVGERGGRLSGGQKQRIALARVILRNPSLLILDEATSQVDPESERLILATLREFVRGRTTLLVSHRMSALTLADRILVIDEGRMVDLGTYDELVRRCELFQRMVWTDRRRSA